MQMDETAQRLRVHAQQSARYAYAPYSHFPVGAAVIGEDGRVHVGCNVENASLGLTQCAERTALTSAIAQGAKPGTLTLLLIYTPGKRAHAPCGACRQVIHELMAPNARIVSTCDTDHTMEWSDSAYLPDPFARDALLGKAE